MPESLAREWHSRLRCPLVHRAQIQQLPSKRCSGWAKSDGLIQLLGTAILRKDSELHKLAGRMTLAHYLQKHPQRWFGISLPLVALIDKKMKEPIIRSASWLVSELGKANECFIGREHIGNPLQIPQADVRFREAEGDNGSYASNQMQLFRSDSQLQSRTPILLRDGTYRNLSHAMASLSLAGVLSRRIRMIPVKGKHPICFCRTCHDGVTRWS